MHFFHWCNICGVYFFKHDLIKGDVQGVLNSSKADVTTLSGGGYVGVSTVLFQGIWGVIYKVQYVLSAAASLAYFEGVLYHCVSTAASLAHIEGVLYRMCEYCYQLGSYWRCHVYLY